MCRKKIDPKIKSNDNIEYPKTNMASQKKGYFFVKFRFSKVAKRGDTTSTMAAFRNSHVIRVGPFLRRRLTLLYSLHHLTSRWSSQCTCQQKKFTCHEKDPSIKNLTNQPSGNQDSLGAYNPFDKSVPTSQTVRSGGEHKIDIPAPSQPRISNRPITEMQKPEAPPPYEATGAQTAAGDDLQRRQEELERKANELQEREARLNATPTGNAKNWPPLPAKCCVGPCFYQDISVEIPDSYQKTVRTMYFLWVFYAFLLFLNMAGALGLFIADVGGGTTFGISMLVFVLFSPMSFICWFRPLYKAFRADSSFNFMLFFFVFFFQFLVSVFYAVGIPNMGSCGLLNGITTLSDKTDHKVSTYTVGIIAISIGFLWAINALVSFYMLVKIHRMYRGTTASFAKAQEELASGVMRNPHVQTAATTAVTQAAQQTFNSAASGLRY